MSSFVPPAELAASLRQNDALVVFDVGQRSSGLTGATHTPVDALARLAEQVARFEADAAARGVNPFVPIAMTQFERTFGWSPNPHERVVAYAPDEASARAGAQALSRFVPSPPSYTWGSPEPWASELALHVLPRRAEGRPPRSLRSPGSGAAPWGGLVSWLRRLLAWGRPDT